MLDWFPQPLAAAFSGQGDGMRQSAWSVLNRFCLLQPISTAAWKARDPSQEIYVGPVLLPPARLSDLTPRMGASLSGWFLPRLVWLSCLLHFYWLLCSVFPWSCFSIPCGLCLLRHILISICCRLSDCHGFLSSCPPPRHFP